MRPLLGAPQYTVFRSQRHRRCLSLTLVWMIPSMCLPCFKRVSRCLLTRGPIRRHHMPQGSPRCLSITLVWMNPSICLPCRQRVSRCLSLTQGPIRRHHISRELPRCLFPTWGLPKTTIFSFEGQTKSKGRTFFISSIFSNLLFNHQQIMF